MAGHAEERPGAEGLVSRLKALFQAVHFAAEALLGAASWEGRIEEVLRRLGQAAGAGGACVFQLGRGQDGQSVAHLRHGWAERGGEPRKGKAKWATLAIGAEGLGDWLDALATTPRARGIMYTTWRNKYDLLAGFGDLVSDY